MRLDRLTKKIQHFPFLPPDHHYIVRHVFGVSHEYAYLKQIEEWRQTYSSEDLDLLLNHNLKASHSVPEVDLFYPKKDRDQFDFNEFEKQTTLNRLKIQEKIRTSSKQIKDCTRNIDELGGRNRSKSIIGFLKTHSKKADTFSRSSSVCSIEDTGLEPVTNIVFAYTYPNKNDNNPNLSILVGTKMGTVTVFPLVFPETQESRELCLQTINIQNSNTVFRLKGNILNLTLLDLDHNGQILLSASKGHQPNRNSKGHASNFVLKTKSTAGNLGSPSANVSMSNVTVGSQMSTSSSGLASTGGSGVQQTSEQATGQATIGQTLPSYLPSNTQQLMVMVSERQARVVALPSQQMIGKCILSPSQLALRADIVYIKQTCDAHCLYVYFDSGQVVTYALPSLRIIKELELEPLCTQFRIESNINFNFDGHLIQFASQSEISKYCSNAALHDNLLALKPTLAKDIEIPEPPKQGAYPSKHSGLIKAVFSFGSTPFEKDEVFSNNSTPQPSTSAAPTSASAKQYKQPAGVEGIRQAAQGTIAGELARTRQAFAERGEAIEKLENQTERMANEAMAFKDISGQLVNKYKDRK